jgi:hypothetical protein
MLLAAVGREAGARGMVDIAAAWVCWWLDQRQVRGRMDRAPEHGALHQR